MNYKKDGGSAFPLLMKTTHEGVNQTKYTGMSLRDWFAGQALVGLLQVGSKDSALGFAERAYIIADAMLKVREEA